MFYKTILCVIFLSSSSIYLIRCQNNFGDKIPNSLKLNFCSAENKSCLDDLPFAEAFRYLQRYGYLTKEKSVDNIKNIDIFEALIQFQKFMAIEMTGVLDRNVVEVMRSHRCSQPDFVRHTEGKRRSKRSLSRNKWLPYNRSHYELPLNWWTEGTDKESYSEIIEKASDLWSNVTNVRIRRLSQLKDSFYSTIIFKIKSVSDSNNSDPRLDYQIIKRSKVADFDFTNDIYYDAFDVDITSTVPTQNITTDWSERTLYFFVHIWGHLLGLDHSPMGTNSVMVSILDNKTDYELSIKDIADVQAFYGPALDEGTNNGTVESVSHLYKDLPDLTGSSPDLCNSETKPQIDSILEMPDETWIIFSGRHYFEMGPNGQTSRSPRRISWDFSNFTADSVDASLVWNDIIFLFSGNDYWKYWENRFIEKRKISEGFKGIPDGPFDDVFLWNRNQKTYFFKGGQYWKYDSKTKDVPNGYPKSVPQNWKGIPESFDAAISSQIRNQTYFFKDMLFYRFDDINKKVVDGTTPPYPRKVDVYFFKCRNTNMSAIPSPEGPEPPRPTPSYPVIDETTAQLNSKRISDKNTYWETLLIVILIIFILIVVVVGGVDAYLYFAVLNRRNGQRNTTEGSSQPQTEAQEAVSTLPKEDLQTNGTSKTVEPTPSKSLPDMNTIRSSTGN